MNIQRIKPLYAKIGIVGVGHDAYWPQFPSVKEILLKKLNHFIEKVKVNDVDVVNFGIIDNSKSAYIILDAMRTENLDFLFIDMLTYATSATFVPLIKNLQIPIVLVALQPLKAMDYANGSILLQLQNDDICAVPEFMQVAVKMGKKTPEVIIGMLEGDPVADAEIAEWCQIAKAVHDLKTARIGIMGHVLECMYDMQVDPSLISSTFGCHIVQTEPDDVMRHFKLIKEKEISEMKQKILNFFDTPEPKSDPITARLKNTDLTIAARTAAALEKFIIEKDLTGLAYYYEGEEGSLMRQMVTNFIVGNSMLTTAGFPMCGEFDLKTCVGMLIMDRLGIGGSFAEFHPLDFEKGTVLMGHDGPHHLNIAEGKPVLRSLKVYHGKPGRGAGVEFQIKEGPITMLGVTINENYALKFVIAEGKSLRGQIPPTGNTNTHGLFEPDLKTFLKRWFTEGPTHHFALGIGHHAAAIQKIAEIMGVESVIISKK